MLAFLYGRTCVRVRPWDAADPSARGYNFFVDQYDMIHPI